jgi:hypothetical protein
MYVHCCHCRDCQRQTGSAFVLNALIEADRVEVLSGETKGNAVPTDSGLPRVIHRCPICQIALWSTYDGREKLRFLRVGTLDDPAAAPPDLHIYTRSKLPWVTLPEGKSIRGVLRPGTRMAGRKPGAPARTARLI